MSLLTEMYESGSLDESLYGFVRRTIKKFTPGRTLATVKSKQRRFNRKLARGIRKANWPVVKSQGRHAARGYIKTHGRKAWKRLTGPQMGWKGK